LTILQNQAKTYEILMPSSLEGSGAAELSRVPL